MLKHIVLLSISVSLLALTGCNKVTSAVTPTKDTSAAAPETILIVGPSTTMSGKACPGTKGKRSVEFIIKNDISKIFSDKKYNGREIYIDDGSNKSEEKTPPGKVPDNYYKTWFDIGVPALETGESWTEIRIIVKKAGSDGVDFLKVLDSNGTSDPKNSAVAVMSPLDDPAKPVFCNRSDIKPSGQDEMVTFGVIPANFTDKTTSFNIGLVAVDKRDANFRIPFYLDPNIKNTG